MTPIPLPTPFRRGLLIAAATCALLLAACGSDDRSTSPDASGSEQTAPPAESEPRGKAGTY